MAVIKSGATTDQLTVDPTSKAARITVYNSSGTEISPAAAVAQGSTTSGQTGPLVQGAVTTAAPSYTTAQTSPLSLSTAGSLRTDTSSIAGVTVVTGNGGVSTGVQRVAIASDNTAFSVNATGPTITKGTQGSTGFTVQDIHDAGRTNLNFYAVAAAAGTTTTETAISLTKSAGTGATSSANSFVITSGKTFRITHLSVATRGNATATIQTTTFNLRLNTGGAVTTSSTPIIFSARSATPATSSAWDRYIIPIPEGFEILGDGTIQFGITAAATYTTNAPTWDVNIIGYEY